MLNGFFAVGGGGVPGRISINSSPDKAEEEHSEGSGLHDVGGDDSLVVLPPGDLTQVQQVPDDCH